MLTEEVIKVANGEEVSEEVLAEHPELKGLTKERAMEHLTWLAKNQLRRFSLTMKIQR